MKRLAMFAGCVFVLAVVSGCPGGGGGTPGPSGPSLMDQYNSAKQTEDPEDRADQFVVIGLKFLDVKDPSTAEMSFKEASRAIEDIRKKPQAQARLYLALADGYQRSGSKSKASTALDGATEAIEMIDVDVTKANQLAALGALRAATGDQDAGLAAAQQAEKLLEKINSPLDKIDVLAGVLRAYGALNNQAELDRVVAAANKLAEAQDRASDKARVLMRVAMAQSSIGQKEAAVATLNKAADVGRDIKDNALMKAHVLFDAAETANTIGQRDLCRTLLGEADDAAKKTPEGGDIINRVAAMREKLGF